MATILAPVLYSGMGGPGTLVITQLNWGLMRFISPLVLAGFLPTRDLLGDLPGGASADVTEKVTQMGGKVVTASDSNGFIYDPKGITPEKLAWIMDLKNKTRGRIKEYAERKVGKIDRFFRGDAEAFITFSSERGRYKAEVTIENNGMFYRVSELTSDMHASIDSACASIDRQIKKNKTRLEKRLREGAFEKEPADLSLSDEEEKDFEIVRSKRFPIKPMTPEEAILQMNLLEHEFFAFKNQSDDNAFAIVYRRKNGGYGLISDAD